MSHENGKNDEKNIEELNKDNAEHIVSGRNEAKQKSGNRSKKKSNKNISLAWVNARNVHDQGRTNENNNDPFSHGSPQTVFISGKCGETYPESDLKLQNNTYHKNNETTSVRNMIEDAPREMQEASDKYENLKRKNQSDLTSLESSENKAETDTDFVKSGVMCQELGSRKPVPTYVPQPEELRIDENVQNHQTLETLEQHCVKNDGKIAITSPSIDSPQSVGDSRDLDENIPGEDTELNFSLSHLDKGKCSTTRTEEWSTNSQYEKCAPSCREGTSNSKTDNQLDVAR